MSDVEIEARSEYRVEEGNKDLHRERLLRHVLWGLIAAAVTIIVVFAVLLVIGATA